ncbi:MAG: VCBS repeat-containing protein [Anaerolineae bacterium]|nr:VCBS repeat-containing protein [Anaerolineae bacterium]
MNKRRPYTKVGVWAAVLLIVAAALIMLVKPMPGIAVWDNVPPAQPGFAVTLSGAPLGDAGIMLADLDGNPATSEIIAVGPDKDACRGRVYAYRPNGSRYWDVQVRAPVNSTPAVADVDGDGVPEVIVGLGGVPSSPCWHGGVVALNGRTGAVEWTFDTQDWLNHKLDGWRDGVYASPAIGDVNGDGKLEIVFGAWDQCIYMLDGRGNPVWPELNALPEQSHCGGHGFYNEDTIWSSAALADLTGDGKLEIIVGADITAGNRYGLPSGGFVYVLRHDGAQLARLWLDQRIYSSPAIADLNKDGRLEIVVGTSHHLKDKGFYVKVLNYDQNIADVAQRLVTKWHLPTSGPVWASPAIGDLNGDGYQDISILSLWGNPPWLGDFRGMKAFGWSGRDGAKLFETPICDMFNSSSLTHSSTVVGKVGHEDTAGQKLLFSHQWEVGVLKNNGVYYTDPGARYSTGNCTGLPSETLLSYWTEWSVLGTPAIGDIDSDGKVEVIQGGSTKNGEYGRLFVWEPGASTGTMPWPLFRQNRFNTGNASVPKLTASTTNLVIPFVKDGTLPTPSVRVINGRAGSVLTWSAAVTWSSSAATDWFTLSQSSGETSTFDTLTLNLNAARVAEKGIYRAQITLSGAPGTDNSPVTVNVTYEVPGPTLDVSPDAVSVFLNTDGPDILTKNVLIRNAGVGGEIEWRATSQTNWITLPSSTGSTDDSSYLVLVVNKDGLADGRYTGTVKVTATTPEILDPEQTITVSMTVGPIHKIYLPAAMRSKP